MTGVLKNNRKQYYDFKINNNIVSIKALKQYGKYESIEAKIDKLKKENKVLKNNYKREKKDVYLDSKKKCREIIETKKKLKTLIKENKRIWDKKTYKIMKLEYEKLKLVLSYEKIKKYKVIYGSSDGKTFKERINKYSKFMFLILLVILFMLPFWIIVSYSTKTNPEAASLKAFSPFIPNGTGARVNYDIALKNLDFWNSIFTTLIITLVSNVLILVFASMAAWQLVRSNTWYSKIIFGFFIMAMILPFQAIMIPLLTQFRKYELTGSVIGTIVAYVGFGMAMSIFMLHGFLKTIPKALEESATVMGMNPFQIFVKIILPLLKTTFITILVLNIMWIWNDYLLPSILLNNPYESQTLQVRLIDRLVSAVASDLKAISAGIVMLIIPPIVYFAFVQKKMVSGITKGSIK